MPLQRDAGKPPEAVGSQSMVDDLLIDIRVRMWQVATCVYNQLGDRDYPLVACDIRNDRPCRRNIAVKASIERYASAAEDSGVLSAGERAEFALKPPLLPEELRGLRELTRSALRVEVADLDQSPPRPLVLKTFSVELLPPTSAPLAIRDPSRGQNIDLTFCLAAFVTPNDPAIQLVLQDAARRHPDRQFLGGQATTAAGLDSQVQAIYETLQGRFSYGSSGRAFSVEPETVLQRVRLPGDTLREGIANCADGAVLFASLLEALSIEAALLLIPGHALVAWALAGPPPGRQAGAVGWQYLDTTLLQGRSYQEARAESQALGDAVRAGFASVDERAWALPRCWPLSLLRTRGINPIQVWYEPAKPAAPPPPPPEPVADRGVFSSVRDSADVWFRKGLQSWRLVEADFGGSVKKEAVQVLGVGIALSVIVEFTAVFLATESIRPDHVVGVGLFTVLHGLNCGVFVTLTWLSMRALGAGPSAVRAIPAAALAVGGAMPLMSFASSEQLGMALELLGRYQEPGRPYLALAIRELLEQTATLSGQVRGWGAALLELGVAGLFLVYGLGRSLSALFPGNRRAVAPAIALTWIVDLLLVRFVLSHIYWRVMARVTLP